MIRIICNIAGLIGGSICTGYLLVALTTWPKLNFNEFLFGSGWLLVSLAVIGWAIAAIAKAEP